MKRLIPLTVASVLALPITATAANAAPAPASAASSSVAQSACTGWISGYKFRDEIRTLRPTSLEGQWLYPNNGSLSAVYNQTSSYTMSVSGTVTLTGDASAIFAGASASIGVTVGGTWSQSKSWSYSVTVARDPKHMYRLHLYHAVWGFQAMKIQVRNCNGRVQTDNLWTSWKTASHAPVKSTSANVWEVDRKSV